MCIIGVDKDSIGRDSGIQYGDRVMSCVMMTKNNTEFSKEWLTPCGPSLETYIYKLKKCFADAIKNKCNLLLFVQRQKQ